MTSQKAYELAIGSNNKTKKLERTKITTITLRHYDGATIMANGITGIWKGGTEKTAIVIVNSDKATLQRYIEDLKRELEQDAIAVRETAPFTIDY